MADKLTISVETLRQLLTYDPETGKLTWLPRPLSMFKTLRACAAWNARYAGTEALNNLLHGYRRGNINNRQHKAHRVAWALYHGVWPEVIDHINGDPGDNRLVNLRAVDQGTNLRNSAKRADNTSGITGVYWYQRDQKWQVKVGRSHIGYFDMLEEAVAARLAAAERRGFHVNHGRDAL